MTTPEAAILVALDAVRTKFHALPQTHADGGDADACCDLAFHLHALENIVAAREGFRKYRQRSESCSST